MKIEDILHKAYHKGIYHETMSIAQDLKQENPNMKQNDRYELAYSRAKQLINNGKA